MIMLAFQIQLQCIENSRGIHSIKITDANHPLTSLPPLRLNETQKTIFQDIFIAPCWLDSNFNFRGRDEFELRGLHRQHVNVRRFTHVSILSRFMHIKFVLVRATCFHLDNFPLCTNFATFFVNWRNLSRCLHSTLKSLLVTISVISILWQGALMQLRKLKLHRNSVQ